MPRHTECVQLAIVKLKTKILLSLPIPSLTMEKSLQLVHMVTKILNHSEILKLVTNSTS